jgi:hypothetical protein
MFRLCRDHIQAAAADATIGLTGEKSFLDDQYRRVTENEATAASRRPSARGLSNGQGPQPAHVRAIVQFRQIKADAGSSEQRIWHKTWDLRTGLRSGRAPCVGPAICDQISKLANRISRSPRQRRDHRPGNKSAAESGQNVRLLGDAPTHLYSNHFCYNATLNYNAFWKRA